MARRVRSAKTLPKARGVVRRERRDGPVKASERLEVEILPAETDFRDGVDWIAPRKVRS